MRSIKKSRRLATSF